MTLTCWSNYFVVVEICDWLLSYRASHRWDSLSIDDRVDAINERTRSVDKLSSRLDNSSGEEMENILYGSHIII